MNTEFDSTDWKSLYAAALFEDDRSKITNRVAEAESAMVLRARALLISPSGNQRESAEIDQSLRMLNLLKSCIASVIQDNQSAA